MFINFRKYLREALTLSVNVKLLPVGVLKMFLHPSKPGNRRKSYEHDQSGPHEMCSVPSVLLIAGRATLRFLNAEFNAW